VPTFSFARLDETDFSGKRSDMRAQSVDSLTFFYAARKKCQGLAPLLHQKQTRYYYVDKALIGVGFTPRKSYRDEYVIDTQKVTVTPVS
jgi:hypothetical protein